MGKSIGNGVSAEQQPDCADLLDRAGIYLQHFNLKEYPSFFEHFCKYAEAFFSALRVDTAAYQARALLDEAQKRSMKPFFAFRREAVHEEHKQFFALYLLPAAEAHGGEGAQAFSEALIEQWNACFSDALPCAGRYEDILSGFSKSIIDGILRRKSK